MTFIGAGGHWCLAVFRILHGEQRAGVLEAWDVGWCRQGYDGWLVLILSTA